MNILRQSLLATLALLVLLTCIGPTAAEEGRNLRVADTVKDKRIALVIGNAKYRESTLKNPVNDALAMAKALRAFGFEVIERTDVTQKEMNRAITQFGQKLSGGGVGLFYYAGHGMQVRGKNFLVPVDAVIEGEQAVRSESVDLDLVMDQLATARVGMVILDACRNNPFERSFRSGTGGGLAQVDAPKGVLVAYATAPGKVAADGTGKNGLYTSELLRALEEPGRRIEDVFKQVRRNVASATNDQQIPWESSSLTGDFFFVAPAQIPAATNAAVETQPGGATDSALLELEMWKSVKDSAVAADFEEYLKQYPEGKFAGLAHARIERLNQAASSAAEQARLHEADLAGKWKFGRSHGTLLAPAGHLCDVELLLAKGTFGNVIKACHSNESFWRLNGDKLEFVGSTGRVTTVFSKNEQGYWEGAFIGMGNLFSDVIHYLKRDLAKLHDGVWSGELETYGGLFNSPVKVSLEVTVNNGQISGSVFMYGENRTLSGRVDKNGDLVDAKLIGSLQGYTLHGKLWEADGEGAMGWKLRFKLTRKTGN
ncbi:MAG: caspase family protein [Gallionella sp.]|nr:caspase family protein [Gallionella sp.]